MAIQIALHRAAHRTNSFVAQTEYLTRLCFLWNLDLRVTVERRNLDLAAERRRGKADRHLAMQIGTLALEHRMRLQIDDDVQVARRTCVRAAFTFTTQANAIVLVDTGWNFHRQRLVLLDAPGAMTRHTRIGNDLAGSMARRTCLLN